MTFYSAEQCVPITLAEIETHLALEKNKARKLDAARKLCLLASDYYGVPLCESVTFIKGEKYDLKPNGFVVDLSAEELSFMGELTADHPFVQGVKNNSYSVSMGLPNLNSSTEIYSIFRMIMMTLHTKISPIPSGSGYSAVILPETYAYEPLYKLADVASPDFDILGDQ